MRDDEAKKRLEKADALGAKGDYRRALEILDDVMSVIPEDHNNACLIRVKQANIFLRLVKRSQDKDTDTGITYFLGCIGCIPENAKTTLIRTRLLNKLGRCLGSVFYFKKCIRSGRQGLAAAPVKDKEEIERLIREAELRIEESKTSPSVGDYREESFESESSSETRREDVVGELGSYWMGLDVERKRGFMKVSVEKLRSFVKGEHRKEGVDVLKNVLDIARIHKKWRVWVCRTKCDELCASAEACRTHLEQKHAADFKPDSEEEMVSRIGGKWAHKIQGGGWKPVETVAAAVMIKTQLEYVKKFTSRSKKNGWSNQWPLAEDEERSGLLKDIKLLLVSLCERQILSCSIRDWVMRFPVKRLGELEVSEESIKDCRIVETPQSICFLESDELEQILGFLKKIKCERHDGTDHVCRAVDSLLDRTRIKENIDIDVDAQFSLLLLDKRLLKRNNAPFDDDRDIKLIDNPDSHYDDAQVKGDDIISWLGDHSSIDKSFPRPIREHNLEIWVAVLRALQYACRTLRTKYAKKKQVLDHEAAVTEKVLLIDAKILLIDNSRIRLLNNLTRLSAFDNRSYILHFLKPFLLSDIRCNLKAGLLLKGKKKSQAVKKKKPKNTKITSTSMASTVEQKPSADLEPGGTSQSPKMMEEDSMEPKDTLGSEKAPLEISSTKDIQEEATKVNSGDTQNMPGEDSVSGNLESSSHEGAEVRYNSALDMTLKALMNINFLKKELKHNKQPFHENLEEEQVLPALQSLFAAVVSEEIKNEGFYRLILRDLLVSLEEVNSMSSGAAEVLVTILESWHCWKNSEGESLVNRLFTLEENERMSCRKCRRMPNYPEQSSYGIVMAADSIRDLKCTFRNMKFVDILRVMRMEYKMLCDINSGGCGTTNFVHHLIIRCPLIFTIVLEWEKSEIVKEISETTKALEWEIDISRLYEGLEPNTNYRLVSMVGYGEEDEEHICMAYEKNRWVNLRRESLAGEVVGNSWKNVVRFCGERRVRPVILLYEADKSTMA